MRELVFALEYAPDTNAVGDVISHESGSSVR